MQWAQAPQKRDQIVLFTRRLDDVLPADDPARLLDEILSRIDWSAWEAGYHARRGQPAIHPRVLASVLLHGLLTRIRSSRKLEESLSLRIVSAEVIAMTNEDEHLVGAIEDVQESFGLETPPGEVLADGLMSSGSNLAALAEKGVMLYSPAGTPDPATNPAMRADPTQPVPRERWDDLPTRGKQAPKLDKSAFSYDAERDCYWCPRGKRLDYHDQTTDRLAGGQLVRKGRYKAQAEDCQGCPLKGRCLLGQSKQRRITRDHHEEHREEHARRMATPEAREKYAKRRHPGERPFAMIKHHFGARRFLSRGLDRVRTEWRWLTAAFNLQRLMTLMRETEQREARAGPQPV